MKALLLTCLLAVSGCAVSGEQFQAKPYTQGQTGYELDWWGKVDLSKFTQPELVSVTHESYSLPEYDQMGIYATNNGFVALMRVRNDVYQTYNPNSKTINPQVTSAQFLQMVSAPVFLRVTAP